MKRRKKEANGCWLKGWSVRSKNANAPVVSGYVSIAPAFLEEILESIEVDSYGYLSLKFALWDNDRESNSDNPPDYTGSITIPEEEEKPRRKRRQSQREEEDEEPTPKRRRVKQVYNEDDIPY